MVFWHVHPASEHLSSHLSGSLLTNLKLSYHNGYMKIVGDYLYQNLVEAHSGLFGPISLGRCTVMGGPICVALNP